MTIMSIYFANNKPRSVLQYMQYDTDICPLYLKSFEISDTSTIITGRPSFEFIFYGFPDVQITYDLE